MLHLYFEGLDAGVTHPLGDFPDNLYLVGKCLLGSDNVYRAFFYNGWWRTPERNHAVLGIGTNVTLGFDDHASCSEPLGPFERIRIVGGSIWAAGRVLARYDESRDEWFQPGVDHSWPIVLIRPGSPRAAATSTFDWASQFQAHLA